MIDIILFIGRVVCIIVLYFFLLAVMRTGIGLVRSQRKDAAVWFVDVEKGEQTMRGLHIDILGPVLIGRSNSSDIVIDEPYVSSSHARFSLQGPALVLEDLGSTNGTYVNGVMISQPVTLREDDEIQIGDTYMRIGRK